jgi:dTDP-4-dehydrorhamnose 3,5-epimerase
VILNEIDLRGAFIIKSELLEDERGFFARTWCQREFDRQGLNSKLVQCNISFNRTKGTLRGMHFQAAPHQEVKLVRCSRGAIYDVIVDLRPESSTFKGWTAVELTAQNRLQLYIPPGFAHGFQTLEDETEIFYQMSEFHEASSARGVRWNDPAFEIKWPKTDNRILSSRDQNYPDFALEITSSHR